MAAIFFFACGALKCGEVPLLRLRRAKRARGFGLLFLLHHGAARLSRGALAGAASASAGSSVACFGVVELKRGIFPSCGGLRV